MEPFEIALAAADELDPQFREAFLEVVNLLLAEYSAEVVGDLLERRDYAAIARLVQTYVDQSFATALAAMGGPYERLITRVGSSLLPASLGAFTVRNPLAEAWVRSHAGRLVVGIGTDAVEAVQQFMYYAFLEGRGAPWAGRQIRSVVGLLPNHAAAVGRYQNGLVQAGFPNEVVEHNTKLYASRLLNLRAETIGRTESIRAAVTGQVQSWQQMMDQGLLDRQRTWLEWMVTGDDRLCPWCAPMDGQRIRMGDYFQSNFKGFPEAKPENWSPGSERQRKGPIKPDPRSQPRDQYGRFTTLKKRDNRDHLDGELVPLKRPIAVPHPPLHPNCRCAVVLRFDPRSSA